MGYKTITYQIQFFSYWHTSSGLSAGTSSSLTVLKDKKDLPTIKGRALKGLIRDAATHINQFQGNYVSEDFIKEVFGIGDDNDDEEKDDQKNKGNKSNAGKANFSNATLSKSLANSITKAQKSQLYHTIASTRINANGVATTNSLRTTEVTIPLTLYAQIEHFPDDEKYEEQLKRCFQWIKRMGLKRNRGLGACEFSITKIEEHDV